MISITKSIVLFPWQQTFEEVTHPDDQVKILNEVLVNIFSNYISNELKKIKPQQVPWITPSIKNVLRKKNHEFKSFIKKDQPHNLLEGIQNMTTQASRLVEDAKLKYFTDIGSKLSHPSTGTKKYWSLINKILNKSKIPEIPPLLEEDIFVTDD